MPAAIRITREEHTADQLRLAATRSKDSAAARRMLALALVLDGASRAAAAQAAGMDRQTLRDWDQRIALIATTSAGWTAWPTAGVADASRCWTSRKRSGWPSWSARGPTCPSTA